MNTEELVKYIKTNDTDDTANDLLYCLNINAENRFQKACKMLDNLIKDVKKTYPDAQYIVYDHCIKLHLGESHTRPERVFDQTPQYAIENDCLIADDYYMDDLYQNKNI